MVIRTLILSCVYVFACLSKLSAQQVTFAPRTSQHAPAPYKGVSTYNVQGDFTMIGNTNLTLVSYRDDRSNNSQNMQYVDVDNDGATVNSSSAVLALPGDVACTEILYAGLYWTGKAETSGNSDFITVPSSTRRLYKNTVKFKKEGQAYSPISAGSSIYYPGSSQQNIYVGYADVTEYVKKHGVGNYFVADLALSSGNGGGTGYFGGWGMVIVYKNPTMPWRDITVFDGYAYNPTNSTGGFNVSGFKAAQRGAIKVKMGMMAGEGDVGSVGDYFEVQQKNSNSYTRLSHSDNKTNNFFNSSIFTGGNVRNPLFKNNTGMDISMFDLPNSGNGIIDNNQTSTRFQYGSTGDLYTIFNIVFAVDAYVPEVEAHNTISDVASGGTVTPGQMLDFKLDVRNKGTEAINNGKIEIPLPNNVYYQSADPSRPGQAPQIGESTVVQWKHPLTGALSNGPATIPGGTIVWTIGNIPLSSADKNRILGALNYRLKVTDNCTVLTTGAGGCGLEIPINGTVTGIGATSTNLVNNTLVKEYGTGNCAGPIYNDFLVTINAANLNCPDVVNGRKQFKAECGSTVVTFDVVKAQYPVGTKFYRTLSNGTLSNEVTTDFPAPAGGVEKATYYARIPGAAEGCYLVLETQSTCCDVNIFFEDFGKSESPTAANDFGRMTSPYMPEGSFTFGTPYPKTDNYDIYAVDNNHYAVVAPGYIKSGHRENQYYFWTPAYNESNTVQDRSGTVDGAVMAINAGTTLKAFYAREAELEKGATYKASFWMYLVNGPSQVGVDIRDKVTGAIIGTTATEKLEDWDTTKKGKWVKYDFHFKVPANIDCDISNVVVEYRNNHSTTQGNDYYIDDISFAKVDPNCAPTESVIDLSCPVVKAEMTLEKEVPVRDPKDNTKPYFNDLNNNGYADKGETITYTFKITNTGNVTLSDMKLIDPLFGGEIAWSADLEEYDEKDSNAKNHIIYKNGLLDAGEIWFVTKTYTLTGADIRKNQVYNKATVTGRAPAGTTVTVDDDVTVSFKGLSLIITNPMLPSKAR